jgi:RNA polymerase sigma-32 factor
MNGLRILLSELERHPVLTREQEIELALRYREAGDRSAGQTLVTSNMRFVIKVALGYRSYGMRLMDLIQEGAVGLMKAVERFDPDRGYRLISFAVWWIKAYIQNYIMRSWSLVKMGTTQAQRKLFYRVSDLPDASDEEKYCETVAGLAERAGVARDEVVSMAARLRGRDLSLDDPMGDLGRRPFADSLPDCSQDQEEVYADLEERLHLRTWMKEALDTLTSRERYIIEKRVLSDDPLTLKELGAHFGVSRERARQIEKAALEKLKGNYLQSGRAAA